MGETKDYDIYVGELKSFPWLYVELEYVMLDWDTKKNRYSWATYAVHMCNLREYLHISLIPESLSHRLSDFFSLLHSKFPVYGVL